MPGGAGKCATSRPDWVSHTRTLPAELGVAIRRPVWLQTGMYAAGHSRSSLPVVASHTRTPPAVMASRRLSGLQAAAVM